MRIGATLADARWRAHLTVDEVSHRTRIREAIIWGIEQDDFSACGGDAYARGHIRAMAQAVGIDPDPLIQQYDETYRTSEDIDDVVVLRPPAPPSPGRPPRPHRRRRLAVTAALGVVVLALVGWTVDHVFSGASPRHGKALAATGHVSSRPASGAAAAGQGSPAPTPTPSAVPTPSPSVRPTAAPSAPPAPASHALAVAGAVPFGPGGAGTGDNPQSAAAAVDSRYSTGWHSDWY
ncbi:MAG TPA: helix-turn-helix transcriptional regulator, partial [Streptosporangiaceae bacterium]